MAPNPKVIAAYRAMANLGIHESKVKPVLKRLLKLYDRNWELIEEENFRALADAIFEEEEKKEGQVNGEGAGVHDEPLQPLKRQRLRDQEIQSSHHLTSCGPSSAASPLKDGIVDKGKQPISPQITSRGRKSISDRAPASTSEPTVEPGNSLLPKNKMPHLYTLIQPKDEPIDDMPDYEIPIAVIPPEESPSGRDSSTKNGATVTEDGRNPVASQCRDESRGVEARQVPAQDGIVDKGKQPVSPQVTSRGRKFISDRALLAASEPSVEPGTSLLPKNTMAHPYALIKPKDEPIDDMPDYEAPIAVAPPEPPSGMDSSMMNDAAGMQDGHDTEASQCRDEGGGEVILPSSNEEATSNVGVALSPLAEEESVKMTPTVDKSKVSEAHGAQIAGGNKDLVLPSSISNGSIGDDMKEQEESISPNSRSSVVVPKQQLKTNDKLTVHDVNDLTKGEERVKISWVNNTVNDFPPSFHYIPRNLVFHDAYVNISLSRIGNEDCCSSCMGNCVLSSKTCSCANKTGGEFAYTAQGLLTKELLEECIGISRNPKNHFYCKDCPLERSKNDGCLEPCKGHIKRKFIKECWRKCGCGKHCGNRIVQRGITCNLQVFLTSEGKGWGLRTLEDLPKGAFVCEFVGEILTIKELHERNLKYSKNGKYTYPVLLDANWDSEDVKDNEALCLDAASYGNIARFINHRCLDANLVEIPVEVEGPDHHYYHLAFFTSRKIAAQEELTWDYGINFDDHDQHIELFQCRCGSKFCRNMKRSNRSIRS